MEAVLVTWQAGGGAQMALGLVRLLAERGHGVRVIGPADLAPRIEAAGGVPVGFPSELEFDPSRGRRMEEQRDLLNGLFFGPALPAALDRALAERPADVVVTDFLLQSAAAAAEAAPAADALLIHTIWGFHGDGATPGLAARADVALVAVPSELDDWPNPPETVVHVGRLVEHEDDGSWESPWPAGDDRPLVVVSLGTTYMEQEEALHRAVEALAALDVRGLVLTGHELGPDEVAATDGVAVRAYVPHAAVLPEASLVVTHAGTGTLLASFAAGVPVLCLPLGRDQPANARRVRALGLGAVLQPDAQASELRTEIEDLLGADDVRARVREFAEVIASYGRGERAVEALCRIQTFGST